MRFQAVIQLEGKTATGFRVPSEVVAALGRGKNPPVCVTIGGHTYRSTVAAYGDVFMLPLSAENRTAAGVAAGDEIEVSIELDLAPREVTVPPDFAAALDESDDAQTAFDALSYSRKRSWVLGIEDARTPETRLRRIARAIEALASGDGR